MANMETDVKDVQEDWYCCWYCCEEDLPSLAGVDTRGVVKVNDDGVMNRVGVQVNALAGE
jgi:hypothetical protein